MIYADYNGSAPVCPQVRDYLVKRLTDNGPYANPNAIHKLGRDVLMAMENSRAVCAKALGAKPKQLIFNSGSTEGIRTIMFSLLDDALEKNRPYFITSAIEHSAVVNTADYYESKGLTHLCLPVDSQGVVKMGQLKSWLKEYEGQISMVSIMAANNETGVIQPFEEIGKLCKEFDAPFFSDTTQYIGKAVFNFNELPMDFAVFSGHKFGAITGTGGVLAKDTTQLKLLVIGGGQEKGLRGGTQNYLGNETMAVALNSFKDVVSKIGVINEARLMFEKKLKEKFPEIVILGDQAPRMATTTYVAYPGVHGQAVQIELESQDIFVTTSSACSDNMPVTSRVLRAMGVSDDVGRGVIRIGLCPSCPTEYYDEIFKGLCNAYEKLVKIKSF